MSTPASVHQASKFVRDALGNPDSTRMQYLLANSALFKELARADFSKIDRAAFTASLTLTSTPIAWRPVSEYVDKINNWNKLRGWGFTKIQIATFARSLVDHLDLLHPTGISLWLGHDFSFNWEEVMACLRIEVEAMGDKFTPYYDARRVSFSPGSEQTGGRKLAPALLDLQTFWNPTEGVVPNEVRKIEKRLPGLEVAWLLALNPQVYVAINYETNPGLVAAGLVVNYGKVPEFGRGSGGSFVGDGWSDLRWHRRSVVRFRE